MFDHLQASRLQASIQEIVSQTGGGGNEARYGNRRRHTSPVEELSLREAIFFCQSFRRRAAHV